MDGMNHKIMIEREKKKTSAKPGSRGRPSEGDVVPRGWAEGESNEDAIVTAAASTRWTSRVERNNVGKKERK